MIVLFRNKSYDLDMPYRLFESVKENHPDTEVEMIERTESSYKKKETARIGDVEDYSVARNKAALSIP